MVFSNLLFVAGTQEVSGKFEKETFRIIVESYSFEHQSSFVQIVSSVCILIKRVMINRIYHRSSMQTEKS